MNNSHRLTPDQQKFYHENGYLLGLPSIYTREEMARINGELPNLLALLRPDVDDQGHSRMAREKHLPLRDRHEPKDSRFG